MNGSDVTAAVESERATRLDRLGSQQSLLALTDARLDRQTVLLEAAAAESVAEGTFRVWAETEGSEPAREAFASVAETEADHTARVLAQLNGDSDPDIDSTPDALHEFLRGLDNTAARIGAGLIGRPLVADRTALQVINFFVNEADERRADLFRDLRADTKETRTEGEALLDALYDGSTDGDDKVDGEDGEDGERGANGASEEGHEWARESAIEAVEIAYEEYAETLEEMGLDPRPIC